MKLFNLKIFAFTHSSTHIKIGFVLFCGLINTTKCASQELLEKIYCHSLLGEGAANGKYLIKRYLNDSTYRIIKNYRATEIHSPAFYLLELNENQNARKIHLLFNNYSAITYINDFLFLGDKLILVSNDKLLILNKFNDTTYQFINSIKVGHYNKKIHLFENKIYLISYLIANRKTEAKIQVYTLDYKLKLKNATSLPVNLELLLPLYQLNRSFDLCVFNKNYLFYIDPYSRYLIVFNLTTKSIKKYFDLYNIPIDKELNNRFSKMNKKYIVSGSGIHFDNLLMLAEKISCVSDLNIIDNKLMISYKEKSNLDTSLLRKDMDTTDRYQVIELNNGVPSFKSLIAMNREVIRNNKLKNVYIGVSEFSNRVNSDKNNLSVLATMNICPNFESERKDFSNYIDLPKKCVLFEYNFDEFIKRYKVKSGIVLK